MVAVQADPASQRALRLFLVSLVVLATTAYLPIVRAGSLGALGGFALPLIMWTPGLSALVAAVVCFRSLAPCGLAIRGQAWLWLLAAWILPAVYTLVIYLPLDALGIVSLGKPHLTVDFLLVGLGKSLLFAMGEELGWRGLLTPLMIRRLGFWRGNLLIGILWAVYHFPAILFAGYARSAHQLYGMSVFTVTVILLTVFLGASRVLSGSVWPAALFHACHNNLFLHLFDPIKERSPAAGLLVGEQGVLLTAVMALLATIGWRTFRRQDPVS